MHLLKTIELTNTTIYNVSNLIANTTYYFKSYVISENGIKYSEEKSVSTLSINDTSWKLSTIHPTSNNFLIYSQVDFLSNKTTKFDELDFPGLFTTYGSWSLDGDTLTYIWENNDKNTSTYVYTGTLT